MDPCKQETLFFQGRERGRGPQIFTVSEKDPMGLSRRLSPSIQEGGGMRKNRILLMRRDEPGGACDPEGAGERGPDYL